MCPHSYHHPGRRSFGGNIPGCAQGAHFPGDEPGSRCRLTEDACGNPGGDTPTECAANSQTEWLCPECQKEGFDSALWKIGEKGNYFCTECESEWTEAELPRAYTSLLVFLVREMERVEQERIAAAAGNVLLQSVIDQAREALGVAV